MSRLRIVRTVLAVALLALASGCGGGKRAKDFYTLPPDEAFKQGQALLEAGKSAQALEVFQSIDLRFADDRTALEPLVRLAIADATFYKEAILDLIDARSLYLDFVTLYGDHDLAPYAQFQAGVCSLAQANHPAKDQSQTRSAFQDLNEVEVRYPNSRFAVAARDMIRQAEGNLAEHEFLVGRFYYKRDKFLAATQRFRNVLKQYPDFEDKEKIYYYLGRALQGSGNDAEARIYLDKLLSDYPEGRFVDQATKSLRKMNAPAPADADVEVAGSPR